MRHYKTHVFHDGIFWRVKIFIAGNWTTLRALHMTREEARKDAAWHAEN